MDAESLHSFVVYVLDIRCDSHTAGFAWASRYFSVGQRGSSLRFTTMEPDFSNLSPDYCKTFFDRQENIVRHS